MANWKQRLYENYVSSGQAGGVVHKTVFRSGKYYYFEKIAKQHLPSYKDISVLDVACGHGTLMLALQQIGYKNVQGIEFSSQQVDLATKLGVTGIQQIDLFEYLSTTSLKHDAIFMMDILEHLTQEQLFEVLDHTFHILRPNGKIIIHIPNAEGILGMRIRYGDLTHELSFTPRSINQLLKTIGFEHIKIYEEKPIVYNWKSLVRRALWECLILYPRLLIIAETGEVKSVLSQNMLVTAQKVVKSVQLN